MEGSVKKPKVEKEEEVDPKLKDLRCTLCRLWGEIVHKFYEKKVFAQHVHCLLSIMYIDLVEFNETAVETPDTGNVIQALLKSEYGDSYQMEQYMLGVLNK